MTVDSAAGFSTAKGSRLATGGRIAAGGAGGPLAGLRRPPRIPLAIGALVASAAALGAMFLLMMLMMLVGVHGLGDMSGSSEETDGPSALAEAEIPPAYLSD